MNILLKRIRQRLSPQSFPDTAEQLEKSDLFSGWWYYSVELLPGLITHISKIGSDYRVRTNSMVAQANQHATELRAYIFNKPELALYARVRQTDEEVQNLRGGIGAIQASYYYRLGRALLAQRGFCGNGGAVFTEKCVALSGHSTDISLLWSLREFS
jgi:hypothetical protein